MLFSSVVRAISAIAAAVFRIVRIAVFLPALLDAHAPISGIMPTINAPPNRSQNANLSSHQRQPRPARQPRWYQPTGYRDKAAGGA